MKYLGLMLAFSLGYQTWGQVITVKDANTKSGIDYVYLYTNGGSVYTDDNGQADISEVIKDQSILKMQHVGYQAYQISVQDLKDLNYTVYLVQSVVNVEEIVVAANKWAQSAREVPTYVKLVDKTQVTFNNPQTAADLLGSSQNVFIQKSQLGGGSPMLRGFSTSRVLLVVDGVRMNTAIFREGNVQNVISLDPNAIQNTEILFGPGASIYGSDALGGVMTFTTLAPNFSTVKSGLTSLNTFVRLSSANSEITGHMDFNFGYKKWALTTSVSFSEFGDLKMGSNGPDEYLRKEYQSSIRGEDSMVQNISPETQVRTGYNQLNLMQKIAFKPNRYARWDLGLHFSTTSDLPRYDRLIQYSGDKLKYADWYYGPQRWSMVNLRMKYIKPWKMFNRFKWNMAYQNFLESRNSRKFNSPSFKVQTETVNAYSTNFDFDKKLSNNIDLFYGLEGVLNKVGSQAYTKDIFTYQKGAIGTRYPDGSTWASAAAYATVKYKIENTYIIDAGMRYSYVYSQANFDTNFYALPFTSATNKTNALTGMVGFTWIPSLGSRVYAHLTSGFRAPNIDDLSKVFDPEPQTVIVPNPNLNAEYLWNGEIGWVQKFAEKYSFEISAFYSYLINAMVRRPTAINGQDSIVFDDDLSQVVSLQNAANAVIYGVQAGVFGDISEHFKAKANINYTQGSTSDGFPLRHAAPLFGQVGVIFTHGWFKADFNWIYNGEISANNLSLSEQGKPFIYLKDKNGDLYSPAWSTLNLKMSFKLNHYLEILGGVENILDVRYRPYSSGIVAPGRNFYFTMRAYL